MQEAYRFMLKFMSWKFPRQKNEEDHQADAHVNHLEMRDRLQLDLKIPVLVRISRGVISCSVLFTMHTAAIQL